MYVRLTTLQRSTLENNSFSFVRSLNCINGAKIRERDVMIYQSLVIFYRENAWFFRIRRKKERGRKRHGVGKKEQRKNRQRGREGKI